MFVVFFVSLCTGVANGVGLCAVPDMCVSDSWCGAARIGPTFGQPTCLIDLDFIT